MCSSRIDVRYAGSRVYMDFLDAKLDYKMAEPHLRGGADMSSLHSDEDDGSDGKSSQHGDTHAAHLGDPATIVPHLRRKQQGESGDGELRPAFAPGDALAAAADAQHGFDVSPSEVAEEYAHLPQDLGMHLTKLKVSFPLRLFVCLNTVFDNADAQHGFDISPVEVPECAHLPQDHGTHLANLKVGIWLRFESHDFMITFANPSFINASLTEVTDECAHLPQDLLPCT